MEIKLFNQEELKTVFRVLRTALSPNELNDAEKSFLKTYAKISGYALEGTPSPILAKDVALEDPHKRKRLVQLSAMAVFLSKPLREVSVKFVDDLAKHLKVKEPVIKVLYSVLHGHKSKPIWSTRRRMAKVIVGEAYRREGILGVIRFFAALLGRFRVNSDKLWNYKRLGLLPEGTLGREYWKHLTEMGFGFPGEAGGIPETVSYHDVSHVLNDHDTTPSGEIQQGSFQGGCRREGGFGFVQFVLLQFHHGYKVTPVAPGEVGYYDPAKVLWAIHRGASFNADVTHGWNYWPLMPLPIEEARAKMGLIAKL